MSAANVHYLISMGATVLIIAIIAGAISYAVTHNGEDDDTEGGTS